LKYIVFIKDEQVKIHRYLSGFPSFISDKIQYDDPKTLEETIKHAKCLYEKKRGRSTFQKSWEDKMKRKVDQRKKAAKAPFFRNIVQGQPTLQEPRMSETMGQKIWKQSIQRWSCGGNHMCRYFPQRGDKARIMHSVQQVAIFEYMGRNMPRIYAALDTKQVEFQSHMIEVEGKINYQHIAILIDSGDSHSYLDPKMVERFEFPRSKLVKPWLVQLATGEKREINEIIKACTLEMNGLCTKFDLNTIPLGSYDCFISMDWLDEHHVVLCCYNKEITF
jgi:hypothetical protein